MLPLLSAACTRDGPVAREPLEASVARSREVENAFSVSWDGPPGVAWVEVGEERRVVGARRTPGPTRIPLVGLAPGRALPWRAVVVDGRGRRHESAEGELVTAEPPPYPFALGETGPDAVLADGHVLLSLFVQGGGSLAAVLDGDGVPVWWVEAEPGMRAMRVRPTADGDGVWIAFNDATFEDESVGRVERYAFDGENRVRTLAPGLHHDFLEEDGGTLVYLSHQRGLEGRPDWIGDEIRRVAVGETDPAATALVFSYEADYPVPAWAPCAHTRRSGFVPGYHEWTHSNSLVPAAEGDGWWVMARFPDLLARVSADGRFLGQVGGRDATWRTLPEPGRDAPAFVHAHLGGAEGDRLMVFDNGDDHVVPPAPSRLVELRVDPEAEVAEVARTWPNPTGRHVNVLGHFESLPGDHRLASWGSEAVMSELDADGAVVWSVTAGDAVLGRVAHLPEFP